MYTVTCFCCCESWNFIRTIVTLALYNYYEVYKYENIIGLQRVLSGELVKKPNCCVRIFDVQKCILSYLFSFLKFYAVYWISFDSVEQ